MDVYRRLIDTFPDWVNWKLCEAIQSRWHQFNEYSRIEYVDSFEVMIADIQPLPVEQLPAIRIAISGWRRLKASLFPPIGGFRDGQFITQSDLMDDPVERGKYAVRLWKAMLLLPVPALQRWLGKRLNRPALYEQGFTWYTPAPAMAQYSSTRVDLERLGMMANGELYSCYCGYHVASDTLYIRKAVR